MRVFLAVAAGDAFVGALSSRLDSARRILPLTWTRPEQWHLTLQFLGDWPAARLTALQEACAGLDPGSPFVLQPGGLGGFPDLRRPRVLFLHLQDDGQLAELAERLRAEVGRVWPDGPQDTKPLRPHLTLARVRTPLDQWELKMLKDIEFTGLPEIPVRGFGLVASQPGPGGASHRMLAEWGMRKKGE